MIGLLLSILACATTPDVAQTTPGTAVHQRVEGRLKRMETVAYRPDDPPNADALWLVESLPMAQWDLGLAAAAGEIISTLRSPDRLMTPRAMATATARTGFPGAARFGKTVTSGAYPSNLVDPIVNAARGMGIDVGLAKRAFADGRVLWVVAWAPHIADMDPTPRTVPLDAGVTVRIDRIEKGDARLFVAPPDAPVRELSMTSGVARWVDGFDVPGEYRFEVVAETGGVGTVALLFSVFADQQPRRMPAASDPPADTADPRAAEAMLFEALNTLRAEHGLQPVSLFPLFDRITREHSALMGHTGIVAHDLPGHGTVAERAAAFAHPRADHFQNVAGAPTAGDALTMVQLSPAHLKNLLCEGCTHVSIGAALEPVLDRIPRLFVTWELLRFPQGAPVEIDHYNR
jgi:hypothetical protein